VDHPAERLLHTEAFTYTEFYTQKLLHADPFTDRCFYTNTFTRRDFYGQNSNSYIYIFEFSNFNISSSGNIPNSIFSIHKNFNIAIKYLKLYLRRTNIY
jgi:hypothetical protein